MSDSVHILWTDMYVTMIQRLLSILWYTYSKWYNTCYVYDTIIMHAKISPFRIVKSKSVLETFS